MKFIELRRMCNARFYALEVHRADQCDELDLDIEREADKHKLTKYAQAEVVRFQPIITDDDAPALEVELNA